MFTEVFFKQSVLFRYEQVSVYGPVKQTSDYSNYNQRAINGKEIYAKSQKQQRLSAVVIVIFNCSPVLFLKPLFCFFCSLAVEGS